MRTGKTNQSATLREWPGKHYDAIDKLEPGYPLNIHREVNGWLDVTAPAKGPRTKKQCGYISKELVDVDEPMPLPQTNVLAFTVVSVAGVGALILLAIMAWG